MNPSSLYRISLVVCLWQCVRLRQVIQLSQQATLKLCLRKFCIEPAIRLEKFKQPLSRQSCYEECLQKQGKTTFLGSRHIKPFLRRIKRDVTSSQGNSTLLENSKCCGTNLQCSNDTEVFRPTGLKATFHKFKDTERFFAIVSWDPLQNISVDWKGYHLVYWIVNPVGDFVIRCPHLGKNVTHYIVDNFSRGLMNKSLLQIVITSYPFVSDSYISKKYTTCVVPKNCPKEAFTTDFLTSSPNTGNRSKDYKVVAAVVSVAFVTAIAAVSLIFWYYRRSKKSTSFNNSRKNEEDNNYIAKYHHKLPHFEYDAFIIYSSKDEEWVKTTLLPTLEEKHYLKCCIHYRNFAPGVLYRENMVDSVYKSRKIVAVVSRNFFNSGFCESEFEYALRRLTEWRDDSLIVIKLDDVDKSKLPNELKQRSYIDCPESVEKETWEAKLVNCLKVSDPEYTLF